MNYAVMRSEGEGDSSFRSSEARTTSVCEGEGYGKRASEWESAIAPASTASNASPNRTRAAHARSLSTTATVTVAPSPIPLTTPPRHATLKLPGPAYRKKDRKDAKAKAVVRERGRSLSRSSSASSSSSSSRSPGPKPNYSHTRTTSFQNQNQFKHERIGSSSSIASSSTCGNALRDASGGLNPALAAAERASRLRVDCICAVCGREGSNFARCPRCNIAWCSRECRVGGSGMIVGTDGRARPKKHVCQNGVTPSTRLASPPGLGQRAWEVAIMA
jgi:hypothetical protein